MDPELRVAHNRIAALTKAWDRDPGLRANLHRIWTLLHEAGHPATSGEGGSHTKPIAPPGWAARKGWRKGIIAKGPVGLLLQSARAYALTLEWADDGPRICQRRGAHPDLPRPTGRY